MEALLLLAAAVIPLFVNYYGFRVFELGKGAWLIACGALVLALSIVALAEGGGEALGALGASLRRPLGWAALWVGAATTVATLAAEVRLLAFFGTPERQQGLLQTLAALALFAAAAVVGRSAGGRRRLLAALVAASVPVALYALTQAANLMAVPGRMEDSRVFGTLSNPIFLGAYLMLLAPLAVMLATRALRGGRTVLASAWIVVLVLQLLALWLTASRGPILGLLAGFAVMALAAAIVAGKRGAAAGALGVALAGVLVLGLLNWRGGPLADAAADVPVLGRFAQISETSEGSQAVRLRVWQATARLVASEPARLATGHGPDSLRHALLPYGDTYLGGEAQADRLVDRSHSVPFDALTMTGLLGLLGQLAFWGAWLYTAVVLLGLAPGSGDKRLLAGAMALGALLLGLGSWFFRPELFGALLALGLLVGLGLYLVAALGGRREPAEVDGLALALLAAGVAGVAEGAFGIRTVVTETIAWILAGLLLARALGDRPDVAATIARGGTAAARRRRASSAGGDDGERKPFLSARGAGVGLIMGLAGCAVLYSLWLYGVAPLRDTSAILILLLLGVAAAAALVAADTDLGVIGTLLVALLVPALYSVLRAIVLGGAAASGRGPEVLFMMTVLWLLTLALLAGVLLAPRAEIGAPPAAGPQAIVYPLLLAGAVAAIVPWSVNPVRGDIAFQQAVRNFQLAATQGNDQAYQAGSAGFERARSLQPRDDGYYLRWGEFFTQQADVVPDMQQAMAVYQQAQELLAGAEAINPALATHTFNRGHLQLLVAQRLAASGQGDPAGVAAAAEVTLDAAFKDMNYEPQVANELALSRLLQGKVEPAIQLLEFSRDQLDPRNAQTWELLARAYEAVGRTADAEAALVEATNLGGGEQNPATLLQRGDLARQEGDLATAITFYEQAVGVLGQNADWKVLFNLGLLYRDNNEVDKAVDTLGAAMGLVGNDQAASEMVQNALMTILGDGASPPPGFPGGAGAPGAPQVP